MRKMNGNTNKKELSPSVEGSRNFDKLSKVLKSQQFSEKMETPFAIIVLNQMLDIIGFDDIINNSIKWDRNQWKVPPSVLGRVIISVSFLRDNKRCPLYHIDEAYEGLDLKLLFGDDYCSNDFNDDQLGKLLSRLYDGGVTEIFSKIAANSYANFKVPFSHILHADTTSHVFYGDCEVCEQEGYEGLNVTYGHSKDKRPELKQIMTGMLVDEHGIPVYEETLDGNTADCTWFKSSILYLQELLGKDITKYTFITDSKLINKKNFEVICADDATMWFISRCPANFYSKIVEKVTADAYSLGKWNDLGTCCEDAESKRAARYESQGFEMNVYGKDIRLIVVKRDDAANKLEKAIKKETESILKDAKKTFKETFSCQPDAEKAIADFLKKYKKSLLNINFNVEKEVIEKKPRGRPSKNAKPPVVIEKFVVTLGELTENKERVKKYKQDKESFVLITNIPEEDKNDKEILQEYKKQKIIETNFEELKKPTMLSTIFLKKSERIEALAMLLNISLLIRALMRVIARMNLENESEPPCIDFSGRPLVRPTADKLLTLLSAHSVVTKGNEHIVYSKAGKTDHLLKLLELLGLHTKEG